ncbi:hypothetical protein XENOCAPTIV_005431 [Xenoophorus captivus]|uniref:Uncharacterized protein n=1 Tax=Xenoophorus captivus TaxID=1517983 RepID=A0ABV0QYQ0_9TELE
MAATSEHKQHGRNRHITQIPKFKHLTPEDHYNIDWLCVFCYLNYFHTAEFAVSQGKAVLWKRAAADGARPPLFYSVRISVEHMCSTEICETAGHTPQHVFN